MSSNLSNSVVVKCNADGSWLSEFEANGRAIFRLNKSQRMILRADDSRLDPYFDAPYEVRDITVTPDAPAQAQPADWQKVAIRLKSALDLANSQRDEARRHAQRLADELRAVLKHGSAGNENLIREALAEWEKAQ